MHEYAIAQSILDVVCQHAAGRRVTAVQLRVGHLRQVVPASLQFAWERLSGETSAEGSSLEVESVPAVGSCLECGQATRLDAFPMRCEHCASFAVRVTQGEELRVESLDVEDEPAGDASAARPPGVVEAFPQGRARGCSESGS